MKVPTAVDQSSRYLRFRTEYLSYKVTGDLSIARNEVGEYDTDDDLNGYVCCKVFCILVCTDSTKVSADALE